MNQAWGSSIFQDFKHATLGEFPSLGVSRGTFGVGLMKLLAVYILYRHSQWIQHPFLT